MTSTLIRIKASERVTWEYANAEEVREGIAWLENDAAYLDKCLADYRAKGNDWMAAKVEATATHSRNLAAMMRAAIA